MKKGIHPKYSEVVFYDTQSDYKFLTKSTMTSKEKIKWEDGKEYPLIKIEVSSASHPFYTGKEKEIDTAGRLDKFRAKQQKAQVAKEVAKKRAGAKAQKQKAVAEKEAKEEADN